VYFQRFCRGQWNLLSGWDTLPPEAVFTGSMAAFHKNKILGKTEGLAKDFTLCLVHKN